MNCCQGIILLIHRSIGTKILFMSLVLEKQIRLIFDLLVNAIMDYRVDRKIFKNEQNSIVEELHEILDDSLYKLDTYTDSMILWRSSLEQYNKKNRLANTLKVTPKQIQHFWEKYYRHPYAVLALYGSVDIKILVKKIEEIERGIKSKYDITSPLNGKQLTDLRKPYKTRDESKLLFMRKNDKISTIKIGWRIDMNVFTHDFYKIYALDCILINDLNSLLLKKLRTEKRLNI